MSFWVGFGLGAVAGAAGVYVTLRWYLLRAFSGR